MFEFHVTNYELIQKSKKKKVMEWPRITAGYTNMIHFANRTKCLYVEQNRNDSLWFSPSAWKHFRSSNCLSRDSFHLSIHLFYRFIFSFLKSIWHLPSHRNWWIHVYRFRYFVSEALTLPGSSYCVKIVEMKVISQLLLLLNWYRHGHL